MRPEQARRLRQNGKSIDRTMELFSLTFVITLQLSQTENPLKMAKQRKRPSKSAYKRSTQPAPKPVETTEPVDRRKFLRRLRTGALIVAGVSASGWYISSEVMAGIEEADLSKIGNGTPTVVQIHDPGCSMCRALQVEARAALARFKDGELQYVVANIKQDKGRQLASEHRVKHVTLLLFDGKGRRQEILTGPNKNAYLERAFRRLLESERKS